MDNFGAIVVKIALAILGVIIVYDVVTHGDAVTSELSTAGNFVTTESKVLEGR